MFDYRFTPTHTHNGNPVQLWHSLTQNPGTRYERKLLTCYDANRSKVEGDARSFVPVSA